MKPQYKRVLLKLSGEGLMGDKEFGVSPEVVASLAEQIKQIHELGTDVCIVIGGGNIFRGAKEAAKGMDRSVADQIGMLATVMNSLFLQDALIKIGVSAKVVSGLRIPQACEDYSYRKVMSYLQNREVVIFAAGTGSPYFTTDTGAALRAAEMGCDALLKSTQVDGVYDSDPRCNSSAKRFDSLPYDEVIKKELKVMDISAVVLAKENKVPIIIFSQHEESALLNAVCAQGKFTIIK
ncbi:MAG: UMP kinase [Alphaproteobacteria bacterium]|nr:UMP kinase [Alphaproteobacteria bacterium]